jgi:hypothetical protein
MEHKWKNLHLINRCSLFIPVIYLLGGPGGRRPPEISIRPPEISIRPPEISIRPPEISIRPPENICSYLSTEWTGLVVSTRNFDSPTRKMKPR